MIRIISISATAALISTSAIAGVCNGVGDWTSCTNNDGSRTQIWNYGNGNYNTMTTDKNGNSKTEYYHNWNEDSGEDK